MPVALNDNRLPMLNHARHGIGHRGGGVCVAIGCQNQCRAGDLTDPVGIDGVTFRKGAVGHGIASLADRLQPSRHARPDIGLILGEPTRQGGLNAARPGGDFGGAAQHGGAGFGCAAVDAVQQGNAFDQIGAFNGQTSGDQRSHRMACNIHRPHAQSLDQLRGPCDIVGQARASGQGGAVAVAGHVDGKDMPLKPHLGAPCLSAQTYAVDQEERLARARLKHPNGVAVRQPQGS